MFEVHPLVSLSARPENDFRLHGLPGHPPIQGPDGAYYGHEWARWRYDTLDVRVDDWLRARSTRTRVLDLGCASGHRAADFARGGCEVTAVDILHRSGEIATRSAELGSRTPGPVAFVQADLRTWTIPPGSSWDLIHARRVISFMTNEEAGDVFARLRPCLADGGLLALSFIASGINDAAAMNGPSRDGSTRLLPGFYAHGFSDIAHRLRANGFTILQAFSDGLCDAGCLASAGPV